MDHRKRKLSPQTRAKLAAFLSGLPEALSARLADEVEIDRAGGGTGLPHGDILEALRPNLRRISEKQNREKAALQRVIETVPREVRNALPFGQLGGYGAQDSPLDLSAPPAGNKFHRAQSFVQILASLRGPALTHRLEHRLEAARSEISSSIRQFQTGLVRELRAVRSCDFAEAYRQPALALGARIMSESELAELRRVKAVN